MGTFIRWLWSNECVTAESRIQITFEMLDALVIFTVNAWPYTTLVGALEITGRPAGVPPDLKR